MTKLIKQILKRALGIIRKRGLAKDDFEEYPRGPVCARGAIFRAIHPRMDVNWEKWKQSTVCQDVELEVLKANPSIPSRSGLADWNNQDERTKEEVERAFEIAIKGGKR